MLMVLEARELSEYSLSSSPLHLHVHGQMKAGTKLHALLRVPIATMLAMTFALTAPSVPALAYVPGCALVNMSVAESFAAWLLESA